MTCALRRKRMCKVRQSIDIWRILNSNRPFSTERERRTFFFSGKLHGVFPLWFSRFEAGHAPVRLIYFNFYVRLSSSWNSCNSSLGRKINRHDAGCIPGEMLSIMRLCARDQSCEKGFIVQKTPSLPRSEGKEGSRPQMCSLPSGERTEPRFLF